MTEFSVAQPDVMVIHSFRRQRRNLGNIFFIPEIHFAATKRSNLNVVRERLDSRFDIDYFI